MSVVFSIKIEFITLTDIEFVGKLLAGSVTTNNS
jgi:hypothetical protein